MYDGMDAPACYAGPAHSWERVLRGLNAAVFYCFLSAVLYFGADRILTQRSVVYRKMSVADKADCAARVYSNLHAVVVPFGHMYTMHQCGIMGDWFTWKCPNQEIVFGFSVGYFAFDMYVLLISKLQYWQAFVAHHFIGASPYAMAFFPGCGRSYFTMGVGMLIEVTNIFMNATWWLDKYGKRDSRLYTISCYANFANWVVFRIVMIYWLAYGMFVRFIPAYGLQCPCVWPHYIITGFLLPFCTYVFFTIVLPDFITQIRETRARRERRKYKSIDRKASHLPGSM